MEQYTDVELTKLSDEQIKNLFFEVRSQLLENKVSNYNSLKNIEIYLCYITREIENRNI